MAGAAVDWIGLYLQEDLGAEGPAGDRTSTPLLEGLEGTAQVVFRERGIAAGLRHAADVFHRLGAEAETRVHDGAEVDPDVVAMHVQGPAAAVLAGERLALNIVGRMSGIATTTRRLADRLGAQSLVAGTRKTTPGFRMFEKEAIALGGGDPHRSGLHDALMVKDNHLAAVGGDVAKAVQVLRTAWPEMELEVEVESHSDCIAAARAGADWILIDNQDPATGRAWAAEARAAGDGVRIEASGGILPADVADYAWADRVSLGALTTDARSLDVALDWRTMAQGHAGQGVGNDSGRRAL